MIQIKNAFRKLPVQLRLWMKWILFVVCLVILALTLTEINTRLFVESEENNEFLATWYGFRVFLVEGEDPYSATMQERFLDYAETQGYMVEENSFESFLRQPLYGIIFFLPFLFIRDPQQAFAWWLTALEFSAVLIAILGVSVLKKDLRKNAIYVIGSAVLMLSSLFFYSTLSHASGAVLSLLFLMTAVKSLQHNGDELTGVLLSFMTVFPFVGWISMLFVLIWSVRQNRMKVLWWFLGTIVLFGFAVALLEPQWLLFYLRMWVRLFNQVELPFIANLLGSVFPDTFILQWFISGGLILIGVVEWAFAWRKDFLLFYWTFQLTLLLESVLTLNISLAAVSFIPTTLVFLLMVWEDRWSHRGRAVGLLVAVVSIGLPWLLSTVFQEKSYLNILWMIAPVVVILLVDMYWIRWWLFRNVKLWFTEAYSLDHPGSNYEQP